VLALAKSFCLMAWPKFAESDALFCDAWAGPRNTDKGGLAADSAMLALRKTAQRSDPGSMAQRLDWGTSWTSWAEVRWQMW